MKWIWHVWGRREIRTGFWWGNPKEGDHLESLGIDGRIILKYVLKEYGWEVWTGFTWPMIGSGGGLL
jgi:hypothetical protein